MTTGRINQIVSTTCNELHGLQSKQFRNNNFRLSVYTNIFWCLCFFSIRNIRFINYIQLLLFPYQIPFVILEFCGECGNKYSVHYSITRLWTSKALARFISLAKKETSWKHFRIMSSWSRITNNLWGNPQTWSRKNHVPPEGRILAVKFKLLQIHKQPLGSSRTTLTSQLSFWGIYAHSSTVF